MATDISKLLQEVIDSRPRAKGLAMIVANSTAPGEAQLTGPCQDLQAMKATFEELRYATFPIVDATAQQIKTLVRAAAHPSGIAHYPRTYERIAFVFAGHGDNGELKTDTGRVNLYDDVILPFQPGRSQHIGDFAKLFFIDACRGDIDDPGVEVPVSRGFNSQRFPTEGNYLLAYSTMPRKKAFELSTGGIWMQTVAQQLREDTDSVLNVLQKVNAQVIGALGPRHPVQQPIFESTLISSPFSLRREAEDFDQRYPDARFTFPPHREQGVFYGPQLELRHPAPLKHSAHPTIAHPWSWSEKDGGSPPLSVAEPQSVTCTHAHAHEDPSTPQIQYDFIEDHSRGQSRYKSIAKVVEASGPVTVIGNYHPTRDSALQEVREKLEARKFLFSLKSRGAQGNSQRDYKSELEEYYHKFEDNPNPAIRYKMKEMPCGFQSTVFAPKMSYTRGESGCRTRKAAENSAAFHMLLKLQARECR